MVQYKHEHLDQAFAALSDSTRRAVLLRLGQRDASITNLAKQFRMTLTGMKKHVAILEDAGLVETEKVGRVRNCKLGTQRLELVKAWIGSYEELWEKRFDALEIAVQDLKRQKGYK
jgi:DNA-binding transcriptional ArsR family regulator